MAKMDYERMQRVAQARKLYEISKQPVDTSAGDQDIVLNGPNYKLKFGKYRGVRLRDLPQQYIEWVLENFAATDGRRNMFEREMNRRIEHSVRQHN